jgi:transposase
VFYAWCAQADIAELHNLAGTVETWWPEIEAFIDTGITNERASYCTFFGGFGSVIFFV